MLDCTNHLACVGVLVVIPRNYLNLCCAILKWKYHCLSSIEEGTKSHTNDIAGYDFVFVVSEGNVTKEQINAAMKAASNESFGYNVDEIVSSDIVGMTYGSLFDATQTMVLPLDNGTTQVQVVSWYDNENSYTSQMVRTIKYFAELA